MSGQTFENQVAVRDAIQEYINKHGVTSLRKIVKYVEKTTGISTTASTVGRLVREYGYDRPKVEWEKVG